MFTEYTLKNVKERRIDSINKSVYEAGATAADGQEYMKVSLWKNDWDKFGIKEGITVKAEMKITEKNGYKNVTLYPERTNTLDRKPNMSKLMDKKAENIKEAQERKNESVAYFNSLNSAIACAETIKNAVAGIPFPTEDDLLRTVFRLRDKFLAEWKKYDAQDVTDKSNPF